MSKNTKDKTININITIHRDDTFALYEAYELCRHLYYDDMQRNIKSLESTKYRDVYKATYDNDEVKYLRLEKIEAIKYFSSEFIESLEEEK